MGQYKWLMFALTGAGFAAITNVLSKKALNATDVFVALCLQSSLMLATLLVGVTVMGRWSAARSMPGWAVGLIVLSGIAGGLSWTFGYQALQLSDVARAGTVDKLSIAFAITLAVIFLHERPTALNYVGIVLMLGGVYCVSHSPKKPEAAAPPPAEHHTRADPPSTETVSMTGMVSPAEQERAREGVGGPAESTG